MAMSKADRCECFNEWGEGGCVCQGYLFGFTYGMRTKSGKAFHELFLNENVREGGMDEG